MESSAVMIRATSKSDIGLQRQITMNQELNGGHAMALVAADTTVERSWQSKSTPVLALLIGLLVAVRVAAAQDIPTGTIELSGGSVAAGIGYTWGSGTLIFDGKKYSVKVQGLSIVHVGVSGYTASGTVYNLKKLSDFNGVYAAVAAGAAIAGGASATAMKNSHGVLIQWVATHAGLNFSLGPKGVTLALAQ